MNMYYSPETGFFYAPELIDRYKTAGSWPDDAYELSNEEMVEFYMVSSPEGKKLGGIAGKIAWVDVPPLSKDEAVALAEKIKNNKITEINNFVNVRQWPGKAALGRLTTEEKKQYESWLDYLDSVNKVNTDNAPNIAWPQSPEA